MCTSPGGWSLLAQRLPSPTPLGKGPLGPDRAAESPVGGLLCSSQPLPCPPPPQLFDIRPIWSRNAVRAKMSVHPDKLKVLLPFMAYYMVSVWRSAHAGPQDGLSEPEQAALFIPPPPQRPPQPCKSTLSHLG